MTVTIRNSIRLILLSGSAACFAQEPATVVEDGLLREVVVTGTYIRNESFQPSSPVDVLSREQLDDRAPTSMAQFFQDLPYNATGVAMANGAGAVGASGGGTINLRNLGSGATLVLLNSRRHTKMPREANNVDVNALVPQIMIKNVEILKDGASATYGSDAVAGVVNILTRDDFEGFEARAQHNVITYTGKAESRIGALWGGSLGESTKVVFGFEYNTRQRAYPEDMPLADGVLRYSTPWNPARYLLPQRNAAGVITARPSTGAFSRLDTGCGTIVQTALIGTNCYYDFGPDNVALVGEDRYQSLARLSHEFSDNLKFKAEVGYGDVQVTGTASSTSSINVSTPITIPGDNPGNTYRAVNSGNQPLFAVPNPSDARLPLRIADANTTLYPLGRVVLMNNPTDPNSGVPSFALGLGASPTATGIAFNEDVNLNGRILGSQGGLPTQNLTPAGEFARSRPYEDHSQVRRIGGGFEGRIGDSTWNWDVSANYSTIDERNNAQRNNVLIRELRLAMQGFGGPNCNPLAAGVQRGRGNCYYFNPFTNATFATPGTPAANRQDVIDWLSPAVWDSYGTSLVTYDAVVSGELFSLPAGPLAVALGGQWRQDGWEVNFDAEKNVGNIETGAVSDDVDRSQIARALFAEVAAPLIDSEGFGSLNLNAALRYEYSGDGVDTTDPKIGLLYRTPGAGLALRASWGTSFLAPTLFQKFTSSSGLQNINDNAPGGTGEAVRRITTLIRGNPDLEPQGAEAYSFGANFKATQRLTLDAGYWHYKFDKLIAAENPQDLVTRNVPGKVVRDSGNNVIFVLPSYVNVSVLETSGMDFQIDYTFDIGDLGAISASAMATWVYQMDVQSSPTAPVKSVVNSLATTVTGAPANLKWRGLSSLSWNRGPQNAVLTLHYNGRHNNELVTAPPGYVSDPVGDATLDQFFWMDAAYSYKFEDLWGIKRLGVTLGAQNILNSKPDKLVGATSATFVDNRLRVAYLRLVANF